MATNAESPLDQLWAEYQKGFVGFDDLTLARWLAQTLGQLDGKVWRLSHPLVGAYRLGAQLAHHRQIWGKHLATPPPSYHESPCCHAPTLPLLTRDVRDSGLLCLHCDETLVDLDDLPPGLRDELLAWSQEYSTVHAVAHREDSQRGLAGDFEKELEAAAQSAEHLLAEAGNSVAPKLLELYPAVIWEDQDECLEVRPEDIQT
jgi:hypothetical protein